MSTTVLVTGAAGYVGSILCEHLLSAGYSVVGVDSLIHSDHCLFHLCANPNFTFIRGDVRDEKLMSSVIPQADVLIPLAALVGAPACDKDPLLAKAVNLEAICALRRLLSKDQLVLYPTTNSGYGTQTGEMYCTEETPLQPISLYGTTKMQAEAELLGSARAISFRLATVFGASPRMRLDLLVNHFVRVAVTDGYIVVFEKHFKRNYVHIRDVADCFLHGIANAGKMVGQAYNLGLDAANLSKEELALEVKRHVPRFYIAEAEIGADPDKRNYIVSNAKLKAAGFEAQRSLDFGIQELLKAYKTMPLGAYRNA